MLPMRIAQRLPDAGPLYEGDRVRRRLRVLADADTFDVDAYGGGAERRDLVAALLFHEKIELYRYSDYGPPGDAATMSLDFAPGKTAAIGWLTAEAVPPGDLRSHALTFCDGHHLTDRAIIAGTIEHVVAGLSVTERVPPSSIEKDALALAAAIDMEADLLVTDRPALLNCRPTLTRGLTVVSPAEAIPLVALYLRSRGEYIQAKSKSITLTTTQGLFFRAAVGMPHALSVVERSAMLDAARGGEECQALAFSSFRRVARALERRDAIWRLTHQPQNFEVAEDTLATFDSFLLFLMAAFDGSARLTNQILNLSVPLRRAAWQSKDWRKVLRPAAPSLADIFVGNTRPAATLNILKSLRNTIHAEGLQSLAIGESHHNTHTGIEVTDPAGSKDLITWAASIAPTGAWGLHELPGDRWYADPGQLMDQLMVQVLKTLEQVFQEIDTLLAERAAPPPPRKKPSWNEETVGRALFWQVGLPE